MLIKKSNSKFLEVSNARGGNGVLKRFDFLTGGKDVLQCKSLSFLSYVILEPGVSIGEHMHEDNFECYFITEGNGSITDNKEIHNVSEGDLLITNHKETHSIKNIGSTTLKIVAFICEK